jgi:hypothetical protein
MTDEAANQSNPLFQQLTAMLATSALQHLGVLPGSEEQGTDLETASMTIDMLDMLAAKTKGNLSTEEHQMLSESLSSIKMAFVQVQGRGDAPPAPPTEEAAPPAPPEAPADAVDRDFKVPERASEEKQPKFHKKYE